MKIFNRIFTMNIRKGLQCILTICLILNVEIGISISCAFAACNIEWWGDRSGSVPTAETSRTEQATCEAHFAIWGGSVDCSVCGCCGLEGYGCGFYTLILCKIVIWGPVTFQSGTYYYWSNCFPATESGNWDVICEVDTDGDNIPDDQDNCPNNYNPGQEDADEDELGDVCDECTDTDNDGYGNPGFPTNTCPLDNCPDDYNPNQKDFDEDGIGDVCDADDDNDGIPDDEDICPHDTNNDIDNDGVCGDTDNCPETPNGPNGGTCIWGENIGEFCIIPGYNPMECGIDGYCSMNQEDTDDNGLGDACEEGDSDADGIPESQDNCPDHYNPNQEDTYPPQGNGIGDACDCEANFDCDDDVDAEDITTFLTDFGRNEYNEPCEDGNQCKGDFSCDGDVDATDVTKFLEDFGRNQYNNPCPACEVGAWCSY